MSYTAPRTWVAAETLTAALLNTHVRDNLLETAVAKVTTKGDLAVATGANALTRLAVGSNGAVLVADSAATPGVRWSGTGKTAAAAIAVNVDISNTLTAAANNDSLLQARIIGVFAKSTFTGIETYGLLIDATNETASGAGTIATAYGLYLTPPTIGTTNWLIYGSGGNSRLGGTSSKVFIGDTSNANMTAGVTVNSGAGDERFCGKLSGFAHGVTGVAETDTALALAVANAVTGGVVITGLRTGSANYGIFTRGIVAAADTTKSTAAVAAQRIDGALSSGTTTASLGANCNIVVFSDNQTTRFILDADGDSHQDVGTAWTNYHGYDDVELLNLLSAKVTRHDDPLRHAFSDWLEASREPLERARIVAFNDDGHHFINWSRAKMLMIGAILQSASRIKALEAELTNVRALLSAGA